MFLEMAAALSPSVPRMEGSARCARRMRVAQTATSYSSMPVVCRASVSVKTADVAIWIICSRMTSRATS